MKRITSLLVFILVWSSVITQEIPAYYSSGELDGDMNSVSAQALTALEAKGFIELGQYNPKGDKKLKVIVYSRKDLQDICAKAKDRGMLAAALKVSLEQKEDGKVSLSILNPEYLFNGYLRDFVDDNGTALKRISEEAKTAIKGLSGTLTGFGGSEDIDDLKDYHYMAFMPYFNDPVTVGEFPSFEEGYNTIKTNLASKKGNTLKVYELYKPDLKTVVFGVGLMDEEKGEPFFLPIIGEANVAAMPYEIILTDKVATILPGKFRFAISWPELTMGEFMKIVNTPGDVEDFMKDVCD